MRKKTSRHLARVRISTQLLLDALAFPEDAQVIACFGERAGYPGEIELVIEQKDLPEVPELGGAPLVTPILTFTEKKPAAWIKFDWNLPDGD